MFSKSLIGALALVVPLVLSSGVEAQWGPAGVRTAGPRRATAGPALEGSAVEWNAGAAEHLLNRAGFGGRRAEFDFALRTGHEAYVDLLLAGPGTEPEPFFIDPPYRPTREEKLGMDMLDRNQLKGEIRREEREQLHRFASWWFEQMLAGSDPLRERMTLFWHGHFTSSLREVREGIAMIRQNELFRERALGNYGDLLRAVLRDPAMIVYLDNDRNRKGNPNENLARELMELFTLGEGNYTEADVKEAARALTGWDVKHPNGAFFFERRHDGGQKTVLGVRGRFDADGLVDVLLAQPACAEFMAGKLIAYFEGREPSPERVASYAESFRASGYEIAPLLRRLFLDPEFYAPEVVGNRIASPVDYVVGSTRRLGLDPPTRLLWVAAGQLGQRVFEPPNVKGWEGGTSWITTSSVLQRGNVVGMLLGVVDVDDVLAPEEPLSVEEPEDMMGAVTMGEIAMEEVALADSAEEDDESFELNRKTLGADMTQLRKSINGRYWPRINLTTRCARLGLATDAEIVDTLCAELLAIEVTHAGRDTLLDFVTGERESLGLAEGSLLKSGTDSEHVLRRLAHLILSMPEAQLL